MKKAILHVLFLLSTLGLSAQTIDVQAPCLGGTFTFTLDETESPDASGRNVYFYEPASIEIQFNTELDRWEVRARGGNFDVYYHNDFASAPNPPDNMTSVWEDNAICDGTGLPTVTGDGTQNTIGEDPCAELGGDSDGDGVCDANDVCPGEDDDLDQDNDNIPDACDDNPTVPDGVLVQSPCLDEDLPVILLVDRIDDTGRNVYINETYQIEVRYDAELARWEVTAEEPGEDVYFYNEFPSFPNPPNSMDSPWTETGVICAGSMVSITGTGTQNTLGCNLEIDQVNAIDASCPDGLDGEVEIFTTGGSGLIAYSLDGIPLEGAGNFTALAVGAYELIVQDTAFPLVGQYLCADTTTLMIDGVDTTPPVASCIEEITVSLDAAGMGTLAATAVNMASVDACGAVSLSLDQDAFSCDDPDTLTVTLTVTDQAGLSSTCTTLVTLDDAEGYCASVPVRDLFGGTDLLRLAVAPNPAGEGTYVDLSGFNFGGDREITLSLFNSLGQRLRTFSAGLNSESNYYVPTAAYPAGVYYLRLERNNLPVASARLLIE